MQESTFVHQTAKKPQLQPPQALFIIFLFQNAPASVSAILHKRDWLQGNWKQEGLFQKMTLPDFQNKQVRQIRKGPK